MSKSTNQRKGNKEKDTNKKEKKPTPMDLLKLEIATELGLADKITSGGWGELTSAESGRIGGIISQRAKKGVIDLNALRIKE